MELQNVLSEAEKALQRGDDEFASSLLREAARMGSLEAMLNLGALAIKATNLGEAQFWYECAAALGNEKARQHLHDLSQGRLVEGQGFTSTSSGRVYVVGERVLHPTLGRGIVLDSWTPSDPSADSMIVQFSEKIIRLNAAELTRGGS